MLTILAHECIVREDSNTKVMHDLKQSHSPHLVLAATLALLGHALLGIWLSTINFTRDLPPTVQFQLVSSRTSVESAASTPAAAAVLKQPPPVTPPIEPTVPAAAIKPPEIIQTQAPAPRTAPKPLPQNEAQKPEARKAPAPKPAPATKTAQKPSKPAPASLERQHSPDSALSSKEDIAETSQVTTREGPPLSDYEKKMKERIAAQISSEPFMQSLEKAQTVMLELQLMRGGVVIRTKIVRSSGNSAMDAAATRAALMASPYGEIPTEGQPADLRYEITLTFSPTYIM